MTAALDIAPDHLALVRNILGAHLPREVQVLVFGSRARGGAKRFSDLDLLLKGQGPVEPGLLSRLADAFEESPLPWRVDLVDDHALTPEFRAVISLDLVPLKVEPQQSSRSQ